METDPPAFDLETYIAGWAGHARTSRLLFIAERSTGLPLELEALKLLHNEVKKTENTQLYSLVVEKINGRLGPAFSFDRQWAEATDRKALTKQERLESELHGYKTNLIKESIRMGHNDLGDFFYERGDLQNAFRCYVRSRDYCTTSKHIITMCLNVIKVAVELTNPLHVTNYASKAESTPDLQSDPVALAKITASSGLALMHSKRYKQAARKFTEVSVELGTTFNNVIAPQDVALYGVLCALASFERSELQQRVMANIGFKEFMELTPEMRELVSDFYNCRYARCLRSLDALIPTLSLDMHLAPYIKELHAHIRQRALVQYTLPFKSVNLADMGAAFGLTLEELNKELARLITDGTVKARIDSHAGILYACHDDKRSSTFQHVLTCGEAYLKETKALLLRANMLQHDFVQKSRGDEVSLPGFRGGGGGGGGGGRRGFGPSADDDYLGKGPGRRGPSMGSVASGASRDERRFGPVGRPSGGRLAL
uniref:PCI domain-containing protein n=1 Tax=Dunaliella tertiolecta TaxID=3047 RepID=A0A7S3R7C1_DUNTE|mmetsp:Transcript_5379/g.14497  ORF Transcript_5379/g.14497 Transcript_5379/m.14497 type:complete len:484 (-) Transcript_5379:403-1854(-)